MSTTRKLAEGAVRANGIRKFNTAFDEETYQQIRNLAMKSGVSFTQQVRLLVEWGLEAEKEFR